MLHPSARRVAGFGTSIFSEVTALAIKHGAVNLGQGFPDFAGPEFIKRAAIAAIEADQNQYAPSPGLPRLRQAVADTWARDYGRAVDWDSEVTITSGATEALCAAALALADPGDTAVVFEPAYDAYAPDLTLAGASAIPVRLHPPDWRFDPDELRAAFARGPRLLLLNTPHNPTGKVFSQAELALIAELCQQHNVLALCDEVYDRLVYDGAVHVPLASLPGMWERTLTLNSTGKTFGVTGWKIGYAVGPAPLNRALRQAHQWLTFASATPLQQAAAVALEQAASSDYYARLRADYDARRRRLCAALAAAGLAPLAVQGSYFVNVEVAPLGFRDDAEFCHFLITEVGVAAIPTSVFYLNAAGAPPLARFCFAKRDETIDAAGERLRRLAARA